MKPLTTLAISACLGLAACASFTPQPPIAQQTVDAFAVSFLDSIQASSIAANETPSTIDLENDIRLGLNGYVSTPGGRVWRTNPDTKDTVQVCGLGCVTRDPGFVPRNEKAVLQRFTLPQLEQRNLY